VEITTEIIKRRTQRLRKKWKSERPTPTLAQREQRVKKRHHYIPKAYLNFFCGQDGMLHVYPKNQPGKVFLQAPGNVGFHKYFYSQPVPDGGMDHNTLEDLFSTFEEKWPPIVEQLQTDGNVDDSLEDIFAFMALQRARVPASRDATERMDAAAVKALMIALDRDGELPPKPEGLENIINDVKVSIDPHRSIHAMLQVFQGIEKIFDRIGLGVMHNSTHIPFLTSDNPVVWFDPSQAEAEMRPYAVSVDGPIVLLFPVTPKLMIYGSTMLKSQFNRTGLGVGRLDRRELAITMNRQICRFAYKAVFAQTIGQEALIQEHSATSPVLKTTTGQHDNGQFVLHEMIFGRPDAKPKWST
jgi:hypothetical protein